MVLLSQPILRDAENGSAGFIGLGPSTVEPQVQRGLIRVWIATLLFCMRSPPLCGADDAEIHFRSGWPSSQVYSTGGMVESVRKRQVQISEPLAIPHLSTGPAARPCSTKAPPNLAARGVFEWTGQLIGHYCGWSSVHSSRKNAERPGWGTNCRYHGGGWLETVCGRGASGKSQENAE